MIMSAYKNYILAIVIMIASVIIYAISGKGLEHNLAGLPHWSTRCPANPAAVLVLGQSQASNTGPRRHISFSASRAFSNGKCYYLRDPIPGTGGRGGTIWPKFADVIGKDIIVANISISGSAIDEWTTPQQLQKVRRTLAQLNAAGYVDPLVIFMQGETDGARKTSASEYYAHLSVLHGLAPHLRWLITRESICYDRQTKWKPLDIARDQLSRDYKDVIIGPDLDNIGLSLRQADHCHMLAEGQARLATEVAVAAKPLLRITN